MSVTLTCTWQPRGELPRFVRMKAQLQTLFFRIVVVLPPDADENIREQLVEHGVDARIAGDWKRGRHIALESALRDGSTHMLYVDFDRLLRWAELFANELEQVVAQLQTVECLIVGRTPQAFATHPRSLRDTEQVANDVFSHLFGQSVDICVATRGFAQGAAEFVLAQGKAATSLEVDGEWPLLLHQADYRVHYVAINGMDWETADQYLPAAADAETQRKAAEAFDQDRQNWVVRVFVAQMIVSGMLRVATKRGHS
jgi:hypothetical protein